MAITNSLPLPDAPPMATRHPLSLVGGTNGEQTGNDTGISFEDGAMKIKHSDGSVTIDFDPQTKKDDAESGFGANLALHASMDGKLSEIASDLIDGVDRDEDSRREWLATRAMGITLLGAKLEKPRGDTGIASAPLEGMSTVRHPLLMEATVSFQATARGELLPAAGPVKVRNDAPPQPEEGQTDSQQELAESLQQKDVNAQALEKDMNHYLTYTATEYIPDTDRMLFYVGFGGDGFKKVYNCPIRQRPVSESIDAEDLIVSNHATDLNNSGRITHRIWMRRSVLRRMQIAGIYRDITISDPPIRPAADEVKKKKEEVEGINTSYLRSKDRDIEILEIYTELDLDQFAPKKFKGKGLPLPYRVTIARESREVLDIRRNWKEDDEECLAKRYIVQYPFIRGLGFYGLGFVHTLGNTTSTLTAAWREMIDAGMFASFPGFIYAKGAGRQNTNIFRVPPGGGIGLEIGSQGRIQDAVMPLPYKEPGPAFTQFIEHVEEVGRRLASTGNVQVGEGKQDAPVGTTLALIEQASKVIDSAHKRLHAAQAEEFKLLKERFREDPEAFWRHNKRPTIDWKKDQFIQALNDCELVPVADPNNPTSLHRVAKAMAIQQMAQMAPELFDPQATALRIMKIIDIDPAGLLRATPAQPPPDPRMAAVSAKAQAEAGKQRIAELELQIKAQELQATSADKAQERASREKIEQMKLELERLRIQQEQVIHQNDMRREAAESQQKMALDAAQHHQELTQDAASAAHEARGGIIKTAQEIQMEHERHRAQLSRDDEKHRHEMEVARQKHEMDKQHAHEMHQAKLEAARQLAKVQKPASKEKS